MKRILSILLAFTLCLCILAGCGKKEENAGTNNSANDSASAGANAGTDNGAETYEIPTEYVLTLTAEEGTVNFKITVDFRESQMTVRHEIEGQGETNRTDYLLDAYGNVVREWDSYDGEIYSINDYVYGADGCPAEETYHLPGDAADDLTVYTARGDTLFPTRYTEWGVFEEDTWGNGSLAYTYDGKGRLLRNEGKTNGGWGESYEYEYDEQGNATKRIMKDDDNVYESKAENRYTEGRLTGITVTGYMGEFSGLAEEMQITVGGYKSFKMTEGQYRCALSLPLSGDVRIFRGASAGGDVRYADGSPLKVGMLDGDGNLLNDTYYLPSGKMDYTVYYRYEGGVLREKTYRTAENAVTMTLVCDETGALAGIAAGGTVYYNKDHGGD